jgi:hypothetical protein
VLHNKVHALKWDHTGAYRALETRCAELLRDSLTALKELRRGTSMASKPKRQSMTSVLTVCTGSSSQSGFRRIH